VALPPALATRTLLAVGVAAPAPALPRRRAGLAAAGTVLGLALALWAGVGAAAAFANAGGGEMLDLVRSHPVLLQRHPGDAALALLEALPLANLALGLGGALLAALLGAQLLSGSAASRAWPGPAGQL
jgi:hypothetical protein